MSNRVKFCSFNHYECHKGFYNDKNPIESLQSIKYCDFFEYPDNEEFPYYSAFQLLCGSCHHFALSLKKALGYTPHVIEGINKRGFHMFCQIYHNKKWLYVDARGITSSFDELMSIAKSFVSDEYIVRQVDFDDIAELENSYDYNEEAYAFAEAVIKKYKELYTL